MPKGRGSARAFAENYRRGQELATASAIAMAAGGDGSRQRSQQERSALTAREFEVAELIAKGLTNREIAAKLMVAKRTADAHVQTILTKLGLRSRAQVAAWISTRNERARPHA